MLHDDSTRLVQKARDAGVDARLLVGQDQCHIWPLFADTLAEGQDALDEIGRFVRDRTARHDRVARG